MSKKTEKPIKPKKLEKKITEKKPIKPIKILKKPAGSVRFWFYKPKAGKNEPNWNRKKPSQNQKNQAKTEKTEPNRFELVFALKNQTETGRFDPVWVRFRFFFF